MNIELMNKWALLIRHLEDICVEDGDVRTPFTETNYWAQQAWIIAHTELDCPSDLTEADAHQLADYIAADTVARVFAKSVTDELTQYQKRRLLQNPICNPACMSHEFMDPNENMMAAYSEVSGKDDGEYELMEVMDLFNAAWNMARANMWYLIP